MKSCILLATVLSMVCHIGMAVDVRLVDLDPPEAQQHIDSHDTTLHYAPKVDSNVPATRVLVNEPTQVLEDIYLANQYHGQDGLGGYLYGYAVPDIAKTERKHAGGDLKGAYNYVSGDGQEIKVEYWDDGTGFHQIDNVPRIQPQQIPDTPEVQAAKEEHARIWAEQAERNSHPIADPNANYRPGQTKYNLPQQQNYLGQGSQNTASYQPPSNNQFGESHVKNYQAQASGNIQLHGSSTQAPAHYGGTVPQQGAAGQQQYGGQQQGSAGQQQYGGQQQGPAGQQQYGGHKQGEGAPQQGAQQQNSGPQQNAGQPHYGGNQPGSAGQQQYGSQSASGQEQHGAAGQQQYGKPQPGSAGQQYGPQSASGQQQQQQQGTAGQQQYGSQSTSGQQQHGAAGQQQYGKPQPGSAGQQYSPQSASGQQQQQQGAAGQQQYGSQPTSGQQQRGAGGQQQYGSQPTSGQQQHGVAGQQQYGSQPTSGQQQHGVAGQQQYGSQPTSGQQQHGAAGQQQYGKPQPGSAGQQQYGSQSASGQQQHGGQQPGGANQNQFGGPESGGGGQKPYGSQFASGQQQQHSGAGQQKYGGSQTGAVGQQQYGGVGPQPGSAGQHYAVTGQPQSYGGQQQHGGQQNVPYSGQHSEVKSTYASASHGGSTGDGEYKPHPNEDNGEYKASSDEEQGPPKGFWYNFDYPVGIIVSKQGGAASGGHQPQPYKRAAGFGTLYEENKKIFESQLKNGGLGVAGGSYQVHA